MRLPLSAPHHRAAVSEAVLPDAVLAQAASDERAEQVVHVLLIGAGIFLALVAFAIVAHTFSQVFTWMVDARWPVLVYAAVSFALIIGGYVTGSSIMWYGIGALLLPLIVLTLLALIGF